VEVRAPLFHIDFNNWFNVGGMTTDSSERLLANPVYRQKLAPVYTKEGIDERA
jgi:hypothetical protein